jgi:hypothetical protein
MTTVYSKTTFELAYERMRRAPIELGEADFAQLGIIEPALEAEARAALREAQLSLVHKHMQVPQTKSVKAAPPETMDEFVQRCGTKQVTWAGLVKTLAQTDGMFVEAIKGLKTELAEARQEIAALKATAYLKDAGLWKHGATYALGDVAQFSGSAWVCTKAHTASGPTADHTCWRLWIKRGKDGKDAR